MTIDAVIIATDIQEGVAGSLIRDKFRLSIDGYSASMEFLLQYYQTQKNIAKTEKNLKKIQLKTLPTPNSGPFLLQYLLHHGYNTELITFFSLEKDRLIKLLNEKPKAVMISTTFFPFVPQIERIAAFVKEHAPESIIIAGGIHIWKSYQIKQELDQGQIPKGIQKHVSRDHYLIDRSKESAIDILVVSDRGEYTLNLLLQKINKGEDYKKLHNIAYFADGQWQINEIEPEPVEMLNEIDWSEIFSKFANLEIPVSVGTGCPFKCSFCDFHPLRLQYRRPIESIIKEIRSIPLSNGTRFVFFTDDNLFFSLKQAKEFCQSIINADLSLRWRSFMRVDAITAETAELMAESGCGETLLGVETGDAELLKNMAKKTTPDKILDALNQLNKFGINTQSTLIVGFPGETDQTIQNTIDLLNAFSTTGPAIHTFYPFLFSVMPLAPVASLESREKYQLRGYMNKWSHYTMNSEEAAGAMQKLYDSVKMELSPIYHGERLVDWLSPEDQKRVIYLRNKLHRIQCGKLPKDDETTSWNELEKIFAGV